MASVSSPNRMETAVAASKIITITSRTVPKRYEQAWLLCLCQYFSPSASSRTFCLLFGQTLHRISLLHILLHLIQAYADKAAIYVSFFRTKKKMETKTAPVQEAVFPWILFHDIYQYYAIGSVVASVSGKSACSSGNISVSSTTLSSGSVSSATSICGTAFTISDQSGFNPADCLA